MKKIILSMRRLGDAIKSDDYSGLTRFIDEFPQLYHELNEKPKNDDSEFKRDIEKLIEYLFVEGKLYEVAKKLLLNSGDMRSENGIDIKEITPLTRKINDLKTDFTWFDTVLGSNGTPTNKARHLQNKNILEVFNNKYKNYFRK